MPNPKASQRSTPAAQSPLSKRRQEMSQKLIDRTQDSYQHKDDSGRNATTFLRTDVDYKLFNAKAGDHLIDVLPFVVGENFPDRKLKAGDIHYVLTVFVHNNLGLSGEKAVCPARTYNQRCPVCELQKQLKDEGLAWDDPQVKALEPQKVCIYNILCLDNDEEELKGVQIWVCAHWNFERHIVELAKLPKGGGHEAFSDPDIGKSISFKREGKGARDTKYLAHAFRDRGYVIPDEYLDQTITLDELLVLRTYDEILALLEEGAPAGAEAPADEPAAAAPAAGRSLLRGQQQQTRAEEPPDDQQSAEESGEKGDEEAPVEGCPEGLVMGVDIDKYEACNSCPVWDDCIAEKERLAEEVKKAAPPARTSRTAAATAPKATPAAAKATARPPLRNQAAAPAAGKSKLLRRQ